MSRKASDDLFELIKSLSKSEKRNFKYFAIMGNNRESTLYVQLFDVIEKQTVYSEEKIQKKIPSLSPTRLSNQKKYLYELITESLQWQHEKQNIDLELYSYMMKSEVLYKKKQFKHALKYVLKGKTIAEKYEKTTLFSQLNIIEEKNLLAISNDLGGIKKIHENNKQDIINSEKTAINSHLNSLNYKIFDILYSQGELNKNTETVLEKIISDPHLKIDLSLLSFQSKILYNQIHSVYYYLKKKYKKGFQYILNTILEFDKKPHQIEYNPARYITILNNFMVGCIEIRNETEIERIIPKLKQLVLTYTNTESDAINSRLNSGISKIIEYQSKSGNFDAAIQTYEGFKSHINKYTPVMIKHEQLVMFDNLFCALYGAGKLKEAQKMARRMINAHEEGMRDDFLLSANLILLAIFHDEGKFLEIEDLIKGLKKQVMNYKEKFPLQLLLIDYFSSTIKLDTAKQRKAALSVVKNKLTEINRGPLNLIDIPGFDFVSWIDSNIQNKRFEDVVKEKWEKDVLK